MRYLIGPVTAEYADQNLHGPRQRGECLAFGPDGADVAIGPADTWESIGPRLPGGWSPDFIILKLAYTQVPHGLWTAPVPLIGLAEDWHLLWHPYLHCLPRCELVFADTPGAECLRRAGLAHVRVGNLSGCGRQWLEDKERDAPKTIDLLCLANTHPAVDRERLPWLLRLARFSDKWNVVIRSGVEGEEHRQLLRRARIVFNRSLRGECNQRVFEAALAGGLLLQEEGTLEVANYFHDRQECVCYRDDNLEELLTHYLEHEEERRAIAEAARAKATQFSFERFWQDILDQVQHDWPALQERARQRPVYDLEKSVVARTWQALCSHPHQDATLVTELTEAVKAQPSAALHQALGLALAVAKPDNPAKHAAIVEQFRRAAELEPRHALAALNLAEALTASGQNQAAVEQANRTLGLLDRPGEVGLDGGHFPPVFDFFRVEWERAAWLNAGNPEAEARAKRDLVRWRLHILLSKLTKDLSHFYEAVLVRPDLPNTRAALGNVLANSGRHQQAVEHLRQAVAANPLYSLTSRGLFDALDQLGDREGQRQLAQDRRWLAKAAPALIRAEDWYQEPLPIGDGRRSARSSTPSSVIAPAQLLAPNVVIAAAGPIGERPVRAADARLPRLPLAAPSANGKVRVSLCLIVKNEEANLPHCLACARDLVDEVVVVDTGSSDRTRDLAAQLGARVCEFAWVDSFAAARNETLRHATGDWIFWMDADDRLDEPHRQKLQRLFSRVRDENVAYLMRTQSRKEGPAAATLEVDHVRLFRSHPQIRWEYRVHEQILPSILRSGGASVQTDIVVRHVGYEKAVNLRGKLDRNLRLLKMQEAENPEDPFTLFNLGSIHLDLQQPEEAARLFRRSLQRSPANYSLTSKTYGLLLHALRALGRKQESEAVCREALERFPDDSELLFNDGMARHQAGDRAGAEACWLRILQAGKKASFSSQDTGVRGYKTRHNLAYLYRELQRPAEAEAQWRAAVTERPDFLPAWLGLMELYLQQGRQADIDQAIRGLEKEAHGMALAAVLRARVLVDRKELAEARLLLQAALAGAPDSAWLHAMLGHVLRKEGVDLEAEQELQAALDIDPGHEFARRQLAELARPGKIAPA